MVGLIFGIIFLLTGIIVGILMVQKNYKTGGILSILGGVALCAVLIFISSTVTVPTGHTGVLTTFGRVESTTLDSGFHVKSPWQSVVNMDNRVQRSTVELACFSSDIQEVTCKYTLNYQISKQYAQDIYRTVGTAYYDTVIVPNVSESVKTVMAQYTAEQLIGSRDALAVSIELLMTEQLARYNIELVTTAIEDLDFTDEFTTAVEAKQVAQQNKLKAQTEQEQKTMESRQAAERAQIDAEASANVSKTKAAADAEVAKIAAQADLEVQKINADASEYAGQKEAAKNKAINESLTGDLLKYYLIQQWDGKYPDTYLGSDNVGTIIDLGE